MWPWEHLAFAYLLASATTHLAWRDSPSARGAAVVGVAALLPDLVDKPLAWWLGVLPSGRSLGHSLVVAVPVVVVLLLAARRSDDPRTGVVFAVAYLSHLAGDVLYPLVTERELRVGFLAWPLGPSESGDTEAVLPHVHELVADFLAFLGTSTGALYLVADVTLVLAALALWVHDGVPGLALVRDAATAATR